MQNDRAFMSWWLTTLAVAAFVFYTVYAGLIQGVIREDVSHITILIAFVVVCASGYLGYIARKITILERDPTQFHSDEAYDINAKELVTTADRALDTAEFIKDACMMLGLLGTVVGAKNLIGTHLAGINFGDASGAAGMLGGMTGALSTVFGCTIFGIAGALIVGLQAFVIGRFARETE